MKFFYLIVLTFFGILQVNLASAQLIKNDNLRVFLDCQSYCDNDYVKREITFVDYVNDRFQANVYILITSQSTGSGGREYKLQFAGQDKFKGVNDTLSYIRQATATDDEDRKLAVQHLKLGLVKYFARTEKAKDLQITFKSDTAAGTKAKTPEKDPWNLWVINLRVNGYVNGDKNYSSNSFSTGFSASRISEKHKTTSNISYNLEKNRFGEGLDAYRFTNKNYYASNTTVWSLGEHLSAGAFVSAQRSDYSNYDAFLSVTPALEYNFFPYKESTNHYVGLMYKAGPRYLNYKEETIFLQMDELRFQQSISLDISYNQKWGQISGSTSFGHYFHDLSKNNLSFSAYTDLRLYKGLSLNFNGYYAFQRDQLNIVKGDITNEDLLTRRRQLDSNYYFYSSFGVRYRFGSLFNNVVNPRFEGGGGGGIFFN
ncbi:hypothetical protein [Daejeonella oryzae]|uniref:hypothetical protein n=1 Tax=Daejeonella oryzae TaxID=1122943 RepID=UPI000414E4BA|nr:hypothetical protein [Daejeonella oryzae]